MCGNHTRWTHMCRASIGSPPRVREPPVTLAISKVRIGITPACAGTTVNLTTGSTDFEDHPRVCGNHQNIDNSTFYEQGSPPRVREPPRTQQGIFLLCRITPACAGTTSHIHHQNTHWGDHPRVCGNHCTPMTTIKVYQGSPPRVREPQASGKEYR